MEYGKFTKYVPKKNKNDESPTVTLYRDAQNLGWGVHMKDQSIGSNWTVNEGKYHINIKEMLAVKFALNSFVKEFSNLSIKLFIDNTTVISILKTWEPPIIFTSTVFVKKYENGAKTEVFGYSAFILIQKNTLADRPSRITYIQAEWMLEKLLFDRVLQTLKFSPTSELFASRLNYQLLTYVSCKPDTNAYAVDAFSLVWKQFKFDYNLSSAAARTD